MEYSSFFNSVSGDRKYKAEDWDRHLQDLISNGVFLRDSTNLQVMSDESGMFVFVQPGAAWVNGKHYLNDLALKFTIEPADGVLNRMDCVVLRLDTVERKIFLDVKKGTFAGTAAPPELQRNADAYELGLAIVSVPAGTTTITQASITDTRLDNAVCGAVHALVDQIGTSTLYAQIQSDLAHFRSANESDFSTWSAQQKAVFTAWLETIKNALDGDTAGNLLNEINAVQENVNAHIASTANPHHVTAAQVGLGNVDNTHDADKSVKYSATAGSAPANGGTADKARYSAGTVALTTQALRNAVISSANPTGGKDGELWFQYE